VTGVVVDAAPAWGVWTLLTLAALAAAADWYLSTKPTTWLRWMSKGAVPALLVVAVALYSVSGNKPSWAAVAATGALALCLLGDLLLLDDKRFISGGVAFAAAHVLFIGALLLDAYGEGWPAGPGVFVALGIVAVGTMTWARRVVSATEPAGMKVMTGSYLALLSLVIIAAGIDSGAPGGWLALAGAVSFYVSDLLLTSRRARALDAIAAGDGPWVMITYHLALFCLAGWALMA
jgi:hypothetical protein